MKKVIISLVLALILVIGVSSMAFADDPTTVDVTWDGGGFVGGATTSGDDASATFQSFGAVSNVGEFHAVDSNDNPYNYNVDSCVFSLETAISGGGFADFLVDRTDAKSSYGLAEQQSYTYVRIDDGLAILRNRSSTNYASMKDCNYGWNYNNHITVTGSSLYTLQRYMDSGNYNYAEINAIGSGDVDLDCMSSEAKAGEVRLGWGCGCTPYAAYDGFNANGSGVVQLFAQGNTSATTAMAPGMTGASSFNFIASWVDGDFSIPDYYITAK